MSKNIQDKIEETKEKFLNEINQEENEILENISGGECINVLCRPDEPDS